jgi:hopanoid biosynthesis associated RND transporter like protein HpnN
MLKPIIVGIVRFCTWAAWPVTILAAALCVGSSIYAARHFAITSDVSQLISSNAPWRQREIAFDKAFPHRSQLIVAVVQAPTPELTKRAADLLAQRLTGRSEHFRSVRQPGSGAFFEQNGLLFAPVDDVTKVMIQLAQARPLMGVLADDPSLRGVMKAVSFTLAGVRGGRVKLDDAVRPMAMLSDTVENVLEEKPASFSWRVLMSGKAEPRDLRRFIEVEPILDFTALEPGGAASAAIRQAVLDLNLASEFGARVRLTGSVPLADEEFSTVKENAELNAILTILAVLIILWLALGSGRIILAVFLTLMVGLALTAALGLMMVGAFNLISVAFAVLFVGLGVDFGIQFSVRYRSERYEIKDLRDALRSSAEKAGLPLTLAAAAVAAGFFSFFPTDYRGLSELGLIAGVGMIIAFITSITLLPSLIQILNPPGEKAPVGWAALAPVDRFMEKNRIAIVVLTGLVCLAGTPLLYKLKFDFNPLNLKSPKVESVATFLELRNDPDAGANAIEILTPSLDDANALAKRVATLPEVARTMTLQNFVPEGQTEKLAQIRNAAKALEPIINPRRVSTRPTDAENIGALNAAADGLTQAAGDAKGPGADAARRLSELLTRLAKAEPAQRTKAEQALIIPLQVAFDDLRNWLRAQPVTLQNIPAEIRRDWITSDNRARLEVSPKGDPNDNEVLRQFARVVLAIAPDATGAPVSLQEAGRTIVHAFIQAGAWSLLSITILLWIALRRFGDVLLTIVPLLVAGLLTLELCVLLDMPLNFANIIALPLLLGIGVAFKIYYIMAWRAGRTNLLQSSLTRAIVFSALTTATAFGSLWFSSHPGTSSMGKLLALALVTTMCAAVLFQPALMGPPREAETEPKGEAKNGAKKKAAAK